MESWSLNISTVYKVQWSPCESVAIRCGRRGRSRSGSKSAWPVIGGALFVDLTIDISWPQTAVLTIHLPGRNCHWKPWSNLLQAALGLQSPSGPRSFLEKYPQKALWDGIPSGAPTTGQTPAQERGEGGKIYRAGPCQSFQVDFADPDMSPLRGLCGNWVGGEERRREHWTRPNTPWRFLLLTILL